MPQTSYTHNTHTVGRPDAVLNDRIKHGYTAAKKRSRAGKIDALRQWNDPASMGSYLVGKATVASDNYAFSGGTEIVITRDTLAAVHA